MNETSFEERKKIGDERRLKSDRCMYCKEMFDLFCAKAKRSVNHKDFSTHPYKPEWCPGRTPTSEYHD